MDVFICLEKMRRISQIGKCSVELHMVLEAHQKMKLVVEA